MLDLVERVLVPVLITVSVAVAGIVIGHGQGFFVKKFRRTKTSYRSLRKGHILT